MACVSKRRGKWVIDYRDQHGIRRWETVKGTRKDADELLAKRIKEVNTGVKIRLITPEMIEAFVAELLENKVGRRTVNKCLTLLSSLFRYALRHRWVYSNPAMEVKRLKEDTGPKSEDIIEDNVLNPEEIQKLLAVFDLPEERWRMIIMTAVLTGLRQGELLGLQWGDIDWNSKQIHVRRGFVEGKFYEPKTKYSRRKVDIPSALISELRKWKLQCPPGEYDLVFPNGAGNPENHRNLLSRGFSPALRRAKLRQIRFHDLRHTYASLLIVNGEHPKYIQSQLGHSSIKITMDVYEHLMNGHNHEATDKLSQLVFGGGKVVASGSRISESGSKMVANGTQGVCPDSAVSAQLLEKPLNFLVGSRRIELRTRGFSGLCSTD